MGIRLTDAYMEYSCEYRDHCPYYTDTNLGVAFSHPEIYQELPTYNNKQCQFYDNERKKHD